MVAQVAYQFNVVKFRVEEKQVCQSHIGGVFLQANVEMAALIIVAGNEIIVVALPFGCAVQFFQGIAHAELIVFLCTCIEAALRIVVSSPQRDEHKGHDKHDGPYRYYDDNIRHCLFANLPKKNENDAFNCQNNLKADPMI
ncbi:hypothetical protein HMPREF1870_02241 [Bacteroidales bacterium KA00344]|nr:hypothetical protein HMPREF1870_02241 [Bacteroidales bacterium KA00344]